MSPSPAALGSVRSAAVINEEIRTLMLRKHPAARLGGGERQEYEGLVEEWTLANLAETVGGGVVAAA